MACDSDSAAHHSFNIDNGHGFATAVPRRMLRAMSWDGVELRQCNVMPIICDAGVKVHLINNEFTPRVGAGLPSYLTDSLSGSFAYAARAGDEETA
jgi:hypothetical protein